MKRNIQPEDLGKTIETDLYVYYENIDLVNKRTLFVGNPNVEAAFSITATDPGQIRNSESITGHLSRSRTGSSSPLTILIISRLLS